jgi:glutamyl/glutaminyl-tRNA synthetase
VTPRPPTTRFAPAPTGRLHLGHLANALFVWGLARARGGRVLLRIEDHDRQRCRAAYEISLLDDLERLGLIPDEPTIASLRAGPSTFRQSDCGPIYRAAVERLRARRIVYACDCSRTTFEAWAVAHGAAWTGPGCPGGCRERSLSVDDALRDPADLGLRAALGDGAEAWDDELLGRQAGSVAPAGDLLVRDRLGNWTYGLCVVVDDRREGVDLVIRGADLLDATPSQIRLGRLLGRATPPRFAHHPLIRRPDGSKLSKADGATAVGELLDAGRSAVDLFGEVAFRLGLQPTPSPRSLQLALDLVT